jgi:hypothetical protein
MRGVWVLYRLTPDLKRVWPKRKQLNPAFAFYFNEFRSMTNR